ncbi:hypothetical protein NLU13_2001 [Sarocladium strictum]|uniref:Uncharacterized protein n=1 Tax=Sarocladium strictum TaxID=5046 RepID=A0AA39LCA2_SARSR|nr:hypothetical protein NLU13_2001 [Sarocladium strictum]
MSSDGNGVGPHGEQPNRQRRSSITQAAMSNLFQRGGSNAGAPVNDGRRRLSVTTLGLSGTQQTASPSFSLRRGSMSTNSNSDSIDESAIEDDDGQLGTKTAPTTPFVRRMSFGAPTMRGYRAGGSPGNDQSGFNWSDQLRSRAESSVTGARPSFSLASSPPRGSVQHDRAKSVSDMPQPPVQAPAPKPQPERRKPDAFQERILKGDFYMD